MTGGLNPLIQSVDTKILFKYCSDQLPGYNKCRTHIRHPPRATATRYGRIEIPFDQQVSLHTCNANSG